MYTVAMTSIKPKFQDIQRNSIPSSNPYISHMIIESSDQIREMKFMFSKQDEKYIHQTVQFAYRE
jgi:hypothetical protein